LKIQGYQIELDALEDVTMFTIKDTKYGDILFTFDDQKDIVLKEDTKVNIYFKEGSPKQEISEIVRSISTELAEILQRNRSILGDSK